VPDDQDTRLHLAMLLARMGLRDECLAELARACRSVRRTASRRSMVAQVHAALGNPEEALQHLLAAQSRGYFVRSELRSSEFELLRGMPDFQKLG
jgi:thioredoxin-like negative regulator of GroEL